MNANVGFCLLDVQMANCLLTLSPQLYKAMTLWLRVQRAMEFLCLKRAKRKSITATLTTIYIQNFPLFPSLSS